MPSVSVKIGWLLTRQLHVADVTEWKGLFAVEIAAGWVSGGWLLVSQIVFMSYVWVRVGWMYV